LRYDLYGYGKSPIMETQKIVHHTADLHELLKTLHIEKTALLGMSMGAEIALNFALSYPDQVSALILVGSGLEGYDYPEEAFAWWGDFIGHIQAQQFDEALSVFTANGLEVPEHRLSQAVHDSLKTIVGDYNYRHYTDEALMWWAEDVPQIERLGELQCPVLLMVGAYDTPTTFGIAEFMASKIPHSQKVIVPDAAHLVNLEQSALFVQQVRDFVLKVNA
jgi:3-oxoadipate enol-lactonase